MSRDPTTSCATTIPAMWYTGRAMSQHVTTVPPTNIWGRVRRSLLFLIVAGAVIIADQISKAWIRAVLPFGQSLPEDGFIRLTHIHNTGGAFGLFSGQYAFLLMTTVVGVGAILLYFVFPPANSRLLDLALGMQLGGAIGNLIDRLNQGYVTDFFDLRVWPVFNVADSCIVTGVAVLAAFLLFTKGDQPATTTATNAERTTRTASDG
ncbi:MAG: signal peptidase II [Chloroflexi bacterium]|nr:signal peptidase II [Chloroflexota bacterium]